MTLRPRSFGGTAKPARVFVPCVGASLLLLFVVLLLATPLLAQDVTLVPVTVDGETVQLAMRIYKPAGPGPAPTLVFNHGSTGRGTDPSIMVRPIDLPPIAQFFVERGWAVVMPARRGRGGSEGEYDEGFGPDRSAGYSCDPAWSIPGADRGLRDIAAAMTAIRAMPFVDSDRVVIGGQSRGGILSVAYAGQNPTQVSGVINFVGGWMGARCVNASLINQTLFTRGARFPGEVLWLYGDDDSFYPLSHSRENFAAFQAAGGKGAFHELTPPAGVNGHRIWGYPELWRPLLEGYLKRQRLERP
jgi:dienelactone hydrolase